MSKPAGAPPQVIRRSDGSFHILNTDIEPLTRVQRVALAVAVWPQVRDLMITAGEYRPFDPSRPKELGVGLVKDIHRHAAQAAQTDFSAVKKVQPRLSKRPDVIQKIMEGKITSINDTQRALGMELHVRLDEGAKPRKPYKATSNFGRGDKFHYAIDPFLRFAAAWANKGYRFAHVNPKEAKKRIDKIDQAIEHLTKIREDLEPRSHAATFKAPSEKSRKRRTS